MHVPRSRWFAYREQLVSSANDCDRLHSTNGIEVPLVAYLTAKHRYNNALYPYPSTNTAPAQVFDDARHSQKMIDPS
jgi:hypothetical protein